MGKDGAGRGRGGFSFCFLLGHGLYVCGSYDVEGELFGGDLAVRVVVVVV